MGRQNSSGRTSLRTRTERFLVVLLSARTHAHWSQHYLGHSINAPTGRWQKNKDVHWYSRDKQDTQDEKALEVKRIKQLEADALAVALYVSPSCHSMLTHPLTADLSQRQRVRNPWTKSKTFSGRLTRKKNSDARLIAGLPKSKLN